MCMYTCKILTIVCANCAVDSYEFTALPDAISVSKVEPAGGAADKRDDDTLKGAFEHKPHFHEWATALPGQGMVVVQIREPGRL